MNRGICCKDCGSDHRIMYMVHDALWRSAGASTDDMLCLACLESRLGRLLTWKDFKDLPINTWVFGSAISAYLKSARKVKG